MHLGQFSLGLAVQDLAKSKRFYETLGFMVFGGAIERSYLIMKQGDTLIDLFQGMFAHNILTFNPGWNASAENGTSFDDVREVQSQLVAQGINVDVEQADLDSQGPAHFSFQDPDGNVIMVD